ncbi:MAG: ABC transporter permease, partial [Myxococcales bacterium]|nr:ABC transporter permease [Myxococcales bacterium]
MSPAPGHGRGRLRWAKIRAVARFELRAVVMKPSFVLSTFGLPLLLMLVGGGTLAIQSQFIAERTAQLGAYGIVDRSGILDAPDAPWRSGTTLEGEAREALGLAGLALEGRYILLDRVLFRLYADLEEATEDARAHRIGSVYVIPEDYLAQGKVQALASDEGPVLTVHAATVEPVLRELLVDHLLAGRVSAEIALRAREPADFERRDLTRSGDLREAEERTLERALRVIVPFLLGVLLMTALLGASGYLVQAVSSDKESKIVEVLLSSVDADTLLTGKLLGLGAAGLIQFTVWSAMVVAAAATTLSVLAGEGLSIPWAAITAAPIFFVLGYLFTGSLMLATGSLGTSPAEAQKLTIGWAVLSVLPLMLILVLMEEPHGAWARLLTFIPFSAPLTIVVRLSVDPAGMALWEIVTALLVLLLATWIAIRVGA